MDFDNQVIDNIDYKLITQNINGLGFEPVSEFDAKEWKQLDNLNTGKNLAVFQQLPNMLKQVSDSQKYEGAYKVVFDKGLGQLQKSANNINLVRGNIVEYGTNNKVLGQAEWQHISPSQVMGISNIILSVYNVCSVVTNQYFLSQINTSLKSLLENINEIQNFLEADKRSLAEANTEFIMEVYSNLEYYMTSSLYTQATLTNIQSIRIKSLADVKFYHRQIKDLRSKMSDKDKKKQIQDNKHKFKKNYYAYNYALKSYNLAILIEILMSGQSDEVWLTKLLDNIIDSTIEFAETYDLIPEYFEGLRILKSKDGAWYNVFPKMLKDTGGMKIELLATFAELSADWILNKENKKKEVSKQENISEMQQYIDDYSNPKDLLAIPLAIEQYSKIQNQKVEILYREEKVYIKE